MKRVNQIGEERCNTCGCLWLFWSDDTMGMAPGEKCGPCCDNAPLNPSCGLPGHPTHPLFHGEGCPTPPVDRSAVTTLHGSTVDEVLRQQPTQPTGQHPDYIVLTSAERAKGFVRHVRRTYKHMTCGAVTTMGQALAETYARDPKFYSGTFCCHCNAHFPVGADGEFLWDGTAEKVGT